MSARIFSLVSLSILGAYDHSTSVKLVTWLLEVHF